MPHSGTRLPAGHNRGVLQGDTGPRIEPGYDHGSHFARSNWLLFHAGDPTDLAKAVNWMVDYPDSDSTDA